LNLLFYHRENQQIDIFFDLKDLHKHLNIIMSNEQKNNEW